MSGNGVGWGDSACISPNVLCLNVSWPFKPFLTFTTHLRRVALPQVSSFVVLVYWGISGWDKPELAEDPYRKQMSSLALLSLCLVLDAQMKVLPHSI